MEACVIHFGMLGDIRSVCVQHKLSTKITLVGGCSCSGIRIESQNETDQKQALVLIKEYLKSKYMYLVQDENDSQIYHPESLLK